MTGPALHGLTVPLITGYGGAQMAKTSSLAWKVMAFASSGSGISSAPATQNALRYAWSLGVSETAYLSTSGGIGALPRRRSGCLLADLARLVTC